MTVRIEKPAINVREELADLRKPSGVAGEAMLRAETPQEQFNLIGAGRRNLLINGGFDVWQRGTSGFTSNGIFTSDRWLFNSAGSTIAVTKETADLELGNVLSASVDTASILLSQLIENGGQYLYNKHHTVSFWVKADAPCTASGRIRNNTTATNYEDFEYNVTTEWNKITHTFSPYTGFSPSDVARLYLVNGTSVATKLYFAQAQLELGKVATPFEHRSYGEELALCKRFFYRHNIISNRPAMGALSYVENSTQTRGPIQFPVEMRASPTFTVDSGTYNFVNGSVSIGVTLSLQSSSPQVALIYGAGSGLTSGQVGYIRPTSNASISFDAEL